MWREIQKNVEFEIGQLHRLVDGHRALVAKVAVTEPDSVEVSALSAYLHSFYNGVENIFKQIALGIDHQRPSSERWHADLLQMMTVSTSNRPAVISSALASGLREYLGFRHFFRSAYTFDIRWERMAILARDVEAVLTEIESSCRALFEDQ